MVQHYLDGHHKIRYVSMIFTVTLDFNLLLKNYSECLFVSSECSLQSSDVCFEVCSDDVQ